MVAKAANHKRFPFDGPINFKDPPLMSIMGRDGFIDQRGRIWLHGFGNLVVYDTLSQRLVARFHRKDKSTPAFLQAGTKAILEDAIGNVWIGTNGNGLFKYTPHQKRFNGQTGAKRFEAGSIRAIYQTKDGKVWVANVDPKLMQANLETGSIQPFSPVGTAGSFENNLAFNQVFDIQESPSGNLWLGTAKGLLRSSENWTDWEFFEIYENDNYPIVYKIHIGGDGETWVLTHSEFGKFDPVTGHFYGHSFLPASDGEIIQGKNIPCLYRQNKNTFWIGTDRGLLKYDVANERFSFLTNDPQNIHSLSHPIVKCILPDPSDPERVLWVGTGGGGLNRFDMETKKFTHYKKKDGLPDDVIYAMLDDEAGNLWMSTNQGLSRFNPDKGIFKNYGAKDGLQDNEFNSGAYFKGADGWLFFGGIRGFNAFLPSQVKDNLFEPPIILTDFKLGNRSVDFKSEGSPLKQAISQAKELTLTWRDNIFSFEFAALDFTEPGRNQYAYMLENFDDEWQHIGTQRSATFTNISPGTYVFKVKGTNHDGTWNEEGTSLKITILPPWWKTWWAFLCYVLLSGAAIWGGYRFQLNRKLEHAEAEKIKEMDALKTRLYTNITHEFRTPLTVIMGMNDQVEAEIGKLGNWEIGKALPPNFSISNFSISTGLIRRNSENLLHLINQLLDLSKLDSGMLRPDLVQADIIPYLQYLTESFYSMAQEQKIRLIFYPEVRGLVMDYDEMKIQQVMYNLISNALKFTGEGGKVVLHALYVNAYTDGAGPLEGRPVLQIKVSDTGSGIPSENLPHIFDRFYQVDNAHTQIGSGSGIGLALTKELVELLQGSISVQSEPGKGTVFTVMLPVTNMADFDQPTAQRPPVFVPKQRGGSLPSPVLDNDPDEASTDELKTVLIVEDNADVAFYIRQLLEHDYHIETAADGQAGIDKALEIVPDIIISDVMMPKKDGFELTETLKYDERTSHVPIILLTAKATDEDKVTGLKTGADAYLMKPFNKAELFVRLEKLLELRQVLQERYAGDRNDIFSKNVISETPTLDDIFIQKIQQAIAEKMENAAFGIEDLCQAVALSSTQVFRKMKALTGESPVRFIQKMRLQKAKELLQTTQLNISEIAYQVGFTDPGYFSRAFNKEFGMSPSAFRK